MDNDKRFKCPIKFLKHRKDLDCSNDEYYWQDSYCSNDEYCQDDCAWCVSITLGDNSKKNVCAIALSSIASINPSMKLYDAEERL